MMGDRDPNNYFFCASFIVRVFVRSRVVSGDAFGWYLELLSGVWSCIFGFLERALVRACVRLSVSVSVSVCVCVFVHAYVGICV